MASSCSGGAITAKRAIVKANDFIRVPYAYFERPPEVPTAPFALFNNSDISEIVGFELKYLAS